MDQKYIWICKETNLNNPQHFQVIYKLIIGNDNKFWKQYKNWNYKNVEIIEKIELKYREIGCLLGLNDKEINEELSRRCPRVQKMFTKKGWIFIWDVDLILVIQTILDIFNDKKKELDKYINKLIEEGLLI